MPFIIADDPGPIGISLAKWIFLPFIVVVLVGSGIAVSLERRKYVANCETAEFEFKDYSPRYWRTATEPTCVCSDHDLAKKVPIN